MSGLTGYLLANGTTDLSSVFMPINAVLSVGSVSLSSNNIFTGTNKFLAGILGPTAELTYTSDMIGYTIKKNGTVADFTVTAGTIYNLHTSSTNGVSLSAGVWMITLYANFQPSNVAGSVQFATTGISTDGVTTYTYVGGTGPISVCGSASIPASANSRISSVRCITIVVPSGGDTYYQLVNTQHTTIVMTCLATTCFFNATRIA
jgi:hypothetical protein